VFCVWRTPGSKFGFLVSGTGGIITERGSWEEYVVSVFMWFFFFVELVDFVGLGALGHSMKNKGGEFTGLGKSGM